MASHSLPNAFESFDSFTETHFKGKKVLVFLDYDGTLTPIVSDPSSARLSPEMLCTLRGVSQYFLTGIITGRSLRKIREFVGLDELYYAGSHGFDIQGPTSNTRHKVADEIVPQLANLRTQVEAECKNIKGVEIEDNIYAVSVHYRNIVHADQIAALDRILNRLLVPFESCICRSAGKKVFELKPKMDWNKGKALIWLLKALEQVDSDKVVSIYIGDDTTDEDAFKVLSSSKASGVGILVTESIDDAKTDASYVLSSPDQVYLFLQKMIEYGKANVV